MLKQTKMNNYKKLLLIVLTALIISFFLLGYMGKQLNNQLYNYVNYESKRMISNVVNYSINEIIEKNVSDNLFTITKNSHGEIELLDYKTKEVNKLLKIINQKVQQELILLEEGKIDKYVVAESFKKGKFKNIKSGIICEIPLGSLKKNALYANFGPSIPIRMSFLSSIKSYVNTKVTEYGFNSLVLEVNLHIEIEEKVTLPTSSKVSTLKIKAPLTLKVIQGIIPEYYYTKGLEKSSNQYATNE